MECENIVKKNTISISTVTISTQIKSVFLDHLYPLLRTRDKRIYEICNVAWTTKRGLSIAAHDNSTW